MVFALSGALGIECQHCQEAWLSAWWIPDSSSLSSPLLLLSLTLPRMWIEWTEITAITHKSIYKDLIMNKDPITLFLYSLLVEYKSILRPLSLLWLTKSTWGWSLYIWYLWTNVSNFTQIRVINFDCYSRKSYTFPATVPLFYTFPLQHRMWLKNPLLQQLVLIKAFHIVGVSVWETILYSLNK